MGRCHKWGRPGAAHSPVGGLMADRLPLLVLGVKVRRESEVQSAGGSGWLMAMEDRLIS